MAEAAHRLRWWIFGAAVIPPLVVLGLVVTLGVSTSAFLIEAPVALLVAGALLWADERARRTRIAPRSGTVSGAAEMRADILAAELERTQSTLAAAQRHLHEFREAFGAPGKE